MKYTLAIILFFSVLYDGWGTDIDAGPSLGGSNAEKDIGVDIFKQPAEAQEKLVSLQANINKGIAEAAAQGAVSTSTVSPPWLNEVTGIPNLISHLGLTNSWGVHAANFAKYSGLQMSISGLLKSIKSAHAARAVANVASAVSIIAECYAIEIGSTVALVAAQLPCLESLSDIYEHAGTSWEDPDYGSFYCRQYLKNTIYNDENAYPNLELAKSFILFGSITQLPTKLTSMAAFALKAPTMTSVRTAIEISASMFNKANEIVEPIRHMECFQEVYKDIHDIHDFLEI